MFTVVSLLAYVLKGVMKTKCKFGLFEKVPHYNNHFRRKLHSNKLLISKTEKACDTLATFSHCMMHYEQLVPIG